MIFKAFSLKVVYSLPNNPDFYSLKQRAFENIVGKGENAGKQHFLLFPQCFLPFPNHVLILYTFNMSSAKTLNFDQFKLLLFGKELDWGLIGEQLQNYNLNIFIYTSILRKIRWYILNLLLTQIFFLSKKLNLSPCLYALEHHDLFKNNIM